MNINNVYVAKIYVKTAKNIDNDLEWIHEGQFVKDGIVYEKIGSMYPVYIDLESGKIYTNFRVSSADVGELYVNIKDGLIPYSSLIETNKKNMPKRKILKNYKNTNK